MDAIGLRKIIDDNAKDYGMNTDLIIGRVFNPHSSEEYFIKGIEGADGFVSVLEGDGHGAYNQKRVSVNELANKNGLEVDSFFKPTAIDKFALSANVNFEEGGELEVKNTITNNYLEYVTLVSAGVNYALSDIEKTNALIFEKSDLIKEYFNKSVPVEATVKHVLGVEKNLEEIDIFYIDENTACNYRKEWFDDSVPKELKVLRVLNSISKNHFFDLIAEINLINTIAITETQACHLMGYMKDALSIDGENKFCLVTYNYEKPKPKHAIAILSNKYFTMRQVLKLKSQVGVLLGKIGIEKGSSYTLTIKQPL